MQSSYSTGPRPYVLLEANLRQLQSFRPRTPILPWGATEAHNLHLPHGTDVYESQHLAIAAAARAAEGGARPLVLPTIPIGNNAQQLDQVATLHLSTSTAAALLADIGRSLRQQGFDRLLLLNGHGGNEFKPLVRDLQQQLGLWVIVANFYQLLPQRRTELFSAPGDHADQSETSLMLHLEPQLVELQHAGSGLRRPFEIAAIDQPGVWTPRPWSHVHPDTGSGDPRGATAELGAAYFEALVGALSELIVAIDQAQPGQLPFCVSHTTTA